MVSFKVKITSCNLVCFLVVPVMIDQKSLLEVNISNLYLFHRFRAIKDKERL